MPVCYRKCGCSNVWPAMLERRTYPPLLAVLLTATLVCLSVFRPSGDCQDSSLRLRKSSATPSFLLVHSSNASQLPDPYDLSRLNDTDFHNLIDLYNFMFLMNDPVCNSSAPPLVMVIVHTAPSHVSNRQAIRTSWGKEVPVVFLVGQPDSASIQGSLQRENMEHRDLVQGSFVDSYRNMTYKHICGLKWVTYHCPGAKYVLKIDDDVFVNVPYLKEFLTREMSALGARQLVLCGVVSSSIVKRSYRSKWRVSPREYADRWYPNYCMGWVILYSPDAVFQLYREAQRTPYFWIDDVHVTGTLMARLNLSHTNVGSLAISEQTALNMLHDALLPSQDFLFSLIPPSKFEQLWRIVSSSPRASR